MSTGFCHAIEGCLPRAQELDSAASLDFTYDSETQVSKLSALWPLNKQSLDFDAHETRRTEVGIFSKGSPPNMGEDDVGMSGILAVLGESTSPSATLFAFASRHRVTETRFSSRFLPPTGLHPTLQLSLSSSQSPRSDDECRPYAYLTLPKTIFADRYQLDDKLFLASKNLSASRYTSLPVDLEAPAYTTKTWGSRVLLELAKPSVGDASGWTIEVPLHLRYLEPSISGSRVIEVPYPAVFWACPGDAASDFGNNPFDRRNLGYDELFEPNTVFWHVNPEPVEGDVLVSRLDVPVLREGVEALIRNGTAAVVALGFVWVLVKLFTSYRKHGYQNVPRERAPETKKTK